MMVEGVARGLEEKVKLGGVDGFEPAGRVVVKVLWVRVCGVRKAGPEVRNERAAARVAGVEWLRSILYCRWTRIVREL